MKVVSGSEELLSKEDFINLKKRNQKEFSFLSKSKYINLKCFDDLIFSDNELKKKIINIFGNIYFNIIFIFNQNGLLFYVSWSTISMGHRLW